MPHDTDAATPADLRPAASRRTVVRGAAHAAWAIPVVTAATAAPAQAATSSSLQTLVVTAAQFWVAPATRGRGSYWVVPGITFENPGPLTTYQHTLRLFFPVADFTGVIQNAVGPRTPYYNNAGALIGATGNFPVVTGSNGDTTVEVDALRYVTLRPATGTTPATSTTFGSFTYSTNPGALAWVNNPTATTVSFTIQPAEAGFGVTAGVMTRVPAPTP